MIDLSLIEITLRILTAVLFGGLIGYEREIKGQSAGFRTHMLVSVGAAIIALIQVEATNQILQMTAEHPNLSQVVSTDYTRLIAQVVSGIGFLGAGAIIVTKKNVSGLATAASIWATAGIGIAIGMGYYEIATIGTVTILTVLAIIKNQLRIPSGESLTVHYLNKEVHDQIIAYFEEREIKFFSTEYRVDTDFETKTTQYSQHYTLNIPPTISIFEVIQEISEFDAVTHVFSQESA